MLKKLVLAASMFAFSQISMADNREVIATMINLEGYLCAEVVSVRELQISGVYEIICIEYRGGSGQVRYIVDARSEPAVVTKA